MSALVEAAPPAAGRALPRIAAPLLRAVVSATGLIALWWLFVWATDQPHFILPSPARVAVALVDRWDIILAHAWITLSEIVLGLLLGTALGVAVALLLMAFPPARRWLLPVLLASQAVPVFAIAPLLTLWMGFGMASKVAMATIIIFFPVASAFYDGLRRAEPGWLDLAATMGASRRAILLRIRLPAALPALASGLRVAAAFAPIGAVVGEWVGASAGLGYLMLHANGRSQTDLMFAALLVLASMALALWFALDALLRALLPWQPDRITERDQPMTELTRRALPALASSLLLPGTAAAQTASPAAAPPNARLTILLDWFINPDHAPIIVAQEGGHFARAGLEVRIIAPADPSDPPKLVAAKQGDIAVYYQKNLYLAIEQGLPLVRVGTVIATPLNTLTVLRDGPIRTLADLRGKRIGFSVAGFEEIFVGTMLERVGLTVRDVRLVNVNFGLSTALMSGQVDAIIGGFRNFELNQLDIENRPGRAFYPEQNGLPVWDELIYVAHRDRARDPLMRRFIDAVDQATHFLVNNSEESWRMFIAGPRRELDNELNRRAWRDTLTRFSLAPGALDRNRYERFARFLQERRMIRAIPPLDSYAVEPVPAVA